MTKVQMTRLVSGLDFKVGDLYWFLGKAHRIVAFEPYQGTLLARLGEGTRTAICDDGFTVTLPAKGYVHQP